MGGLAEATMDQGYAAQHRAKRSAWRRRGPVALGGLFGLVALAAGWLWLADGSIFGDAVDPNVIARGEKVYQDSCAKCHGVDLKGEFGEMSVELIKLNDAANERRADGEVSQIAPPHDASGQTWRYGEAKLFEIIKFGGNRLAPGSQNSRMPGFEGTLADDEIVAVIAYMKQFWPEAARDGGG